MWLLFVYWATQATWKYFEEEISTTSFNIKSKNLETELPIVTICQLSSLYMLEKDNYGIVPTELKNMIKNDFTYYFYERLESNVDLFYEKNASTFYDIYDVVNKIHINNEVVNTEWYSWTPVYHYKYGLCYSLDIKKEELDMKIKRYEPITLALEFDEDNFYDVMCYEYGTCYGIALLHDSDSDLFIADQESPVLRFDPAWNSPFFIRKTKISTESTPNEPCGSQFPLSCRKTQLDALIQSNYNCTISFLNNGNKGEG